MKILIQGLGTAPASAEFALLKEKPDLAYIICSEYQKKFIRVESGYTEPNWAVVEKAVRETGTKIKWCICDIFDIKSIGETVAKIFDNIRPTDQVIINYTSGSAGVQLVLGASAVMLSRILPIRIVSSIRYKGGMEFYKDQSDRLKSLFESLYGSFYERMEKTTLAGIINAMADAIVVLDLDGMLVFTNDAFSRMFGANSKEFMGKPITELFEMQMQKPEEIEKFLSLVKHARMERSVNPVECVYTTADKETVPMSIVGGLLSDAQGNPTHMVAVIRDITELKRAEEVLREQYARLKEIDEMKSRFLSTATHELRTPLVSIKGYTSMIRMGHAGKVPKEIDEMLEIVERNANRLSALTNDLLDQQRLESGRFQITPEPLKLQDIVDEAVKEIQPLVSKKNQQLSIQVPPDLSPVKADKTRIIQVLINLLSNAFKYTPSGGSISLQIREAGEMVEVRVSDTGTGIAKEDMGKLFQPFPDIKKLGDEISTGLGLSICRGIIDLHGGRIWAESEGQGKGTTFTFTIPKHRGVYGR